MTLYKQIKKELLEASRYEPKLIKSPQLTARQSETRRLFDQLLPNVEDLNVKQKASKLLHSSSSLHLKSTSNLYPIKKRLSEKSRKELRLASNSQSSLDMKRQSTELTLPSSSRLIEPVMDVSTDSGLLRHISPRNKYGIEIEADSIKNSNRIILQKEASSSHISLPVIKNYHLTRSRSLKYDPSIAFTSGSTSRMTQSTNITNSTSSLIDPHTRLTIEPVEPSDSKFCQVCTHFDETGTNNETDRERYQPLSKLSNVRGKIYLNIFIPLVIKT